MRIVIESVVLLKNVLEGGPMLMSVELGHGRNDGKSDGREPATRVILSAVCQRRRTSPCHSTLRWMMPERRG